LFGGPKKAKLEPKTVQAPEPEKKAQTFSFFGRSNNKPESKPKQLVQDSIPVLSKWIQNSDGSLTGLVNNSKDFRAGTKITTSPVRKGAKAGSVVITGSGSQYKLI